MSLLLDLAAPVAAPFVPFRRVVISALIALAWEPAAVQARPTRAPQPFVAPFVPFRRAEIPWPEPTPPIQAQRKLAQPFIAPESFVPFRRTVPWRDAETWDTQKKRPFPHPTVIVYVPSRLAALRAIADAWLVEATPQQRRRFDPSVVSPPPVNPPPIRSRRHTDTIHAAWADYVAPQRHLPTFPYPTDSAATQQPAILRPRRVPAPRFRKNPHRKRERPIRD